MKNVQDKRSNISPRIKSRSEDKPNDDKGTQCFECEFFGHIKEECPTFLKRQKKGTFNHVF